MIDCPECGAHHYPGTLFCDVCGAAVHPAAQAHVAGERPSAILRAVAPAPPAPPPMPALRVSLPHHNAEMILRVPLIQVGRADPEAGFAPELDLTIYKGQERGVSRRHATIEWIEGAYVLIDQHSSNGTWLEGRRLVAGDAYRLPARANVRFGGLLVQLALAD
jgi:hypothetical protein